MNTDKSKRLLKKVQALFDNLSEQGNVSTLERDLLLSYLRDLYEEISSSSSSVSHIHDTGSEPVRGHGSKKVSEEPVAEKPLIPTVPEWKEPPRPIVHEPVHTRVDQIAASVVQETVAIASQVFEPLTPKHSVQMQPPVPVMSGEGSLSRGENDVASLFQFKEIGELAERLKLQPIERIEHGMGINERILSINELFSGDSELFRKTVDYLNNLQSFSDAQAYLIEGVATQFNWADEARKSKASFFIGLVRRRYAGIR